MAQYSRELIEDASDLFAKNLDPLILQDRIAQAARTRNLALDAAKKASAAGDTNLARELETEAAKLQEIIEQTKKSANVAAPDRQGMNGSSASAGTNTATTDSSTDGDEEGSEADKDKNEPDTPAESSNDSGVEDALDNEADNKADDEAKGTAESEDKAEDEDSSSNNTSTSEEESEEESEESEEAAGANNKSDNDDFEEEDESGGSANDNSSSEKTTNADSSATSESESSEENENDENSVNKVAVEDKKILQDPFHTSPIQQELPDDLANQLANGELEFEKELDAIIRIISKLSGEARQGAEQALKDKFQELDPWKRTYDEFEKGLKTSNEFEESLDRQLTEDLKGLDLMSETEFDSLIDGVLTKISKVSKVDYSSDLAARVQEIKSEANDVMKNRELAQEDDLILGAEKRIKRAQDREKNKYDAANFKNIDAFKLNFFRAIKDQVEEYEDEEDSWSAINRRHEDDPTIIMPGSRMEDKKEDIPSIDVYFDQSGSWDDSDIEIGRAAVSIINEYDRRGEIRLNIYYFANHVHTTPEAARMEGGTNAWKEILQTITANKTKNAVIITDRDMSYSARTGPKVTIDGCVWFVWKNGENSQELPAHLVGRRGNFQYAFRTQD